MRSILVPLMMTNIEKSVVRVRAWIARSEKSHSVIAIEAGLADRTLKRYRDASWNPRRSTLYAVERMIPVDFEPDCEAKAEEVAVPDIVRNSAA